jgi:hypothetical protein
MNQKAKETSQQCFNLEYDINVKDRQVNQLENLKKAAEENLASQEKHIYSLKI